MEEDLFDGNTDRYDIVMNTHGDLLPFYGKHKGNVTAINGKKSKINITYCHYPLLPYEIRNGTYRTFLEKYTGYISSSSVDELFTNAYLLYNII
jgi:hypothetical protein